MRIPLSAARVWPRISVLRGLTLDNDGLYRLDANAPRRGHRHGTGRSPQAVRPPRGMGVPALALGSPHCVDVIKREYEVAAGDAATLIETSGTFEVLAARRW